MRLVEDDLPRPQDLAPAEGVPQPPFADHVHPAMEEIRELILQVDEIEQAPACLRLELH